MDRFYCIQYYMMEHLEHLHVVGSLFLGAMKQTKRWSFDRFVRADNHDGRRIFLGVGWVHGKGPGWTPLFPSFCLSPALTIRVLFSDRPSRVCCTMPSPGMCAVFVGRTVFLTGLCVLLASASVPQDILLEAINANVPPVTDMLYASLIGGYVPEIKGALIDGKSIEGNSQNSSISFLSNSLREYHTAVNKLAPHTSTSCLAENCTDQELSLLHALPEKKSSDSDIVGNAISKLDFALEILELLDKDPVAADRTLRSKTAKLDVGASYVLPIGWHGDPAGHAMMLEVEKEADNQVMIRVYNLGAGISQYHAGEKIHGENLVLPFHEIVNVDGTRLFGGGFVSMLAYMSKNKPMIQNEHNSVKWDHSSMYEVILGAVGGDVSSRSVPSSSLRTMQYNGNCAMASALAIVDKLLVSDALSERFRVLALMRGTVAFLKNVKRGDVGRRHLAAKGIRATFEQIERALEARGFDGTEIAPIRQQLLDLRNELEMYERKSVERFAETRSIHFSDLKQWGWKAQPKKGKMRYFGIKEYIGHKQIAQSGDSDSSAPRTLQETPPSEFNQFMANFFASITGPPSKESMLSIKRACLELNVSQSYWEGIPEKGAVRAMKFVQRLQEVQFFNMRDILNSKDCGSTFNSRVGGSSMLAILKCHTIIDMLSQTFADHLSKGAKLPHFHSLYLLRLLGSPHRAAKHLPRHRQLRVPGKVTPLNAVGPWRQQFLSMQNYWFARLPAPGPSFSSIDPFGLQHWPICSKMTTKRRYGTDEEGKANAAEHNAKLFGQTLDVDDAPTFGGWAMQYRSTLENAFEELGEMKDTPDKWFFALFARKDKDGKLLIERLPGLMAGISSSYMIELLRRVHPADLASLRTFENTGYSVSEPKTSKGRRYIEMARILSGNAPTCRYTLKDEHSKRGWLAHKCAAADQVPVGNPWLEETMYISPGKEKEALRGARRRLSANTLVTPLEYESMFSLNTQDVRDYLALSTAEGSQVLDTAIAFSRRMNGLVGPENIDRQQVLMDLLLEPGPFEANARLEESFPESVSSFLEKGTELANVLQELQLVNVFNYLILSSRFILRSMVRAGDAIDLSKPALLAPGFEKLLQRFDDTENKTLIHFYRASAFQHCELIESWEDGCQFISSFYFLQSRGYPTGCIKNKEMRCSPGKFQHEYHIHESFENLRFSLKSMFDDETSRSKMLNCAVRELLQTDADLESNDNRRWVPFDSYPLYKSEDGAIFYDADNGDFISNVLAIVKLPFTFFERNPFYATLFGDGVLHVEKKVGRWEYEDTRRRQHYRFQIVKDEPVIQRMFEGRWYQANDPSVLNLPFAPGKEFEWGGIAWVPKSTYSANDAFFTDKYGQEFLKLSKDGYNWRAVHITVDTNENCAHSECELVDGNTIANHANSPNSSWWRGLSGLEDLKYAFVYTNDNGLAKIHLPRLGITFGKLVNNVLISSDTSEFGVKDGHTQALSIFGEFDQYITVFEPHQHLNGIIIPDGTFDSQHTDGLRSFTRMRVNDSDGWNSVIKWYLYRNDTDSGIFTPVAKAMKEKIRALAHISAIFLSERKYAIATKYIGALGKELRRTSDIGRTELSALHTIVSFKQVNNDSAPEAASLRLRAYAMLRRQIELKLFNTHADINPVTQQQVDPEAVNVTTGTKQWLEKPVEDMDVYEVHLNRIGHDIRLSCEDLTIINGKNHVCITPRISRRQAEVKQYNISLRPVQTDHFNIGSKNLDESLVVADSKPIPGRSRGISDLLLTGEPLFVEAFPKYLVDLLALLRDYDDVSKRHAHKHVLEQLRISGMDHMKLSGMIDRNSVRDAVITFVQLRYRYLNNVLSKYDFNEKVEAQLTAEAQILGTLVQSADGSGPTIDQYEKWATECEAFLISSRLLLLPKYSSSTLSSQLVKDGDQRAVSMWSDVLKELPSKVPFLNQKMDPNKRRYENIGPVWSPAPLIAQRQLIAFDTPRPELSDLEFTRVENLEILKKLETEVVNEELFRKMFEIVARDNFIFPPSPFDLGTSTCANSQNVVLDQFKLHNAEYERTKVECKEIPRKKPDECDSVTNVDFVLKAKDDLEALLKEFIVRKDAAMEKHTEHNSRLQSMLNDYSNIDETAYGIHADVRVDRQVQSRISTIEAKTVFAMGKRNAVLNTTWDVAGEHLYKLNPTLSKENISRILNVTFLDMLYHREYQRLSRVTGAISKYLTFWKRGIRPIPSDVQNDLWFYLAEKIEYDPLAHPVLLLAETELKIAIWGKQLNAIQDLGPEDMFSSLVELTMGLGKTAVISPVTLSLVADGHTLPILVMPASLVNSMSESLQSSMHKAFNRDVRVIPIDRCEYTVKDIERLRQEFELMVKERIPLVWSASDLQTLINSFLEDLFNDNEKAAADRPSWARKLKAWQQLFGFLRNKARMLGDEIHAILDILTSFNFALGTRETLHEDEMDAVADFLHVFTTDHRIVSRTSLPFDSVENTNQASLTDSFFRNEIKPVLVDIFIERGITNDERCKTFISNLDDEKRDLLKRYLMASETVETFPSEDFSLPQLPASGYNFQTAFNLLLPDDQDIISTLKRRGVNQKGLRQEVEDIFAHYLKLTFRMHNFLAVQKESMRSIFVHTATQQFRKHYALNREQNGAIPADDGKPLWDSLFRSSLERLYYTSFMFMQLNISQELVQEDLEEYILRLREEMKSSANVAEFLLNNNAMNEFKSRYQSKHSLQAGGFTKREIREITNWVNSNHSRQLPLIRQYFYKEQKVFRREIESSTHMIPMVVQKTSGVQGMSGTLFNRYTYPHKLFQDVEPSKTVYIVSRRILSSNDDPNTMTMSLEGTIDDIISHLYESQQKSGFGPGSIIDSTGYLDKERSEEIARAMLRHIAKYDSTIEKVIFYDGDTSKTISKDGNTELFNNAVAKKNIKLRDSLIAFWDVSHTTGADLTLRPTAASAMIVSKHLRLFELAQAAMRLRGLGTGQRVQIIVPEDDRRLMVDTLNQHLCLFNDAEADRPLKVEDVIKFALLNELLQETENNYRAVELRFRMALLEPVVQTLWNPQTKEDEARKIYNFAKSLFVKEQTTEPREQYLFPIFKKNTQTALDENLQQWKNHPVLSHISEHPSLFPGINVDNIKATLDDIRDSVARGTPLVDKVDASHFTGGRQMAKENAKTQQKMKQKQQLKQFTYTMTLEKQNNRVKYTADGRKRRTLRRKPYSDRPVLLNHKNIWTCKAHEHIPLNEALGLRSTQLLDDSFGAQSIGGGVLVQEVLQLDDVIEPAFKFQDKDVMFSLNLAPVWQSAKSHTVPFTPYDYSGKFSRYTLFVQEKMSGKTWVKLLDTNDVADIAQKMRNDPGDGEVRLEMYRLHSSKSQRVAVGHEQIMKDDIPKSGMNLRQGEDRFNELLFLSKFFSGLTRFNETKQDSKYLDDYLHRLEKQTDKFFTAYAGRLGRFLNSDSAGVQQSNYTDVGKNLNDTGLNADIQDKYIKADLRYEKNVQDLLYSLRNSAEDRLRIVTKLHDASAGEIVQTPLCYWSTHTVPLLPVLFDGHHRGKIGDASLLRGLLRSPQDCCNDEATVRLWIMRKFFNTVHEEFTAWLTAVPTMHFNPNEDERRLIESQYQHGCHGKRLLLELSRPQDGAVTQVKATIASLEIMAELSDPIYGLPNLVEKAEDLGKLKSKRKNKLQTFVLSRQRPTNARIAISIGLAAVESVDLVRSLDAACEKYEFEYLYFLFQFLAKHNKEDVSRTVYGMKLFPRLFRNDLKSQSKAIAEYIATGFTVSTEAVSEGRILKMWQDSFQASNEAHKGNRKSQNLTKISWWGIISSTRSFTSEALADSVAVFSGEWLSGALVATKSRNWFLDGVLYHLLRRHAHPVVGHNEFRRYFELVNKRDLLVEILKYANYPTYNKTSISIVVDSWEVHKKYNLLVELVDLRTLNRPNLTVAEMASDLSEVMGDLNAKKYRFCNVSIDFFVNSVALLHHPRRFTARADGVDKEKAIISFLSSSDIILSRSGWVRFLKGQHSLSAARLDSRKFLQMTSQKQDELLRHTTAEMVKLCSSDRVGVDAVVQTIFLEHYLIRNMQLDRMAADVLSDTLQNMVKGATSKSREWKGEDIDKWPEEPDWRDIVQVSMPMTFGKSVLPDHMKQSYIWLNKVLEGKEQTNWVLDGLIVEAISRDVSSVEHEGLSFYFDSRVEETRYKRSHFLADIISRGSSSTCKWKKVNDSIKPLITWTEDDFDLFADLSDTKTKSRKAPAYFWLAQRLTERFADRILKDPSMLHEKLTGDGLNKVVSRAASTSNCNNSYSCILENGHGDTVSKMISTCETVISANARLKKGIAFKSVKARFDNVITPLNKARLMSDFSPNNSASSNLVNANVEMLVAKTSNLRKHIYLSFILDELVPQAIKQNHTISWVTPLVSACARETKGQAKLVETEESGSSSMWNVFGTAVGIEPVSQSAVESLLLEVLQRGDGIEFGFAVDKNVPLSRSWAMDKLILNRFEKQPSFFDHINLDLYIKERDPQFKKDVIDTIHLDKRHAYIFDKYSRRTADLDVYFELAGVATRRGLPQYPNGEVPSQTLSSALRYSLDTQSFTDDMERNVTNTLLMNILKRYEDVADNEINRMLGVVDTELVQGNFYRQKGLWTKYSGTTHHVNDLRMKVLFKSSDPVKNLVAAIDELLGTGCSDARRTLYVHFIPEWLMPALDTQDSKRWVDPVLETAVQQSWPNTLSPAKEPWRVIVQDLLVETILFKSGDIVQIGASSTRLMEKHVKRPTHVLDEVVVKTISVEPRVLQHSVLQKYGSHLSARIMSARNIAPAMQKSILKFSGEIFDVMADMIELQTDGRKNATAEDLIVGLVSGLSKSKSFDKTNDFLIITSALEKISERLEGAEKIDKLFCLLDANIIKKVFPKKLTETIHKLRKKVYFSSLAPSARVVKAMQELVEESPKCKAYLRKIYRDFIPRHLVIDVTADDQTWVAKVVQITAQSGWLEKNALDSEWNLVTSLLKDLLLSSNGLYADSFAAAMNDILASMADDPRNIVDFFALQGLLLHPEKIHYPAIERYGGDAEKSHRLLNPPRAEHSLLTALVDTKNRRTAVKAFIGDNRFCVFADLIDMKTPHREPAGVDVLSHALKNGLDRGIAKSNAKDEIYIVEVMMQKIKDRFETGADKNCHEGLFCSLEDYISGKRSVKFPPSVRTKVYELLYRVEYENIATASERMNHAIKNLLMSKPTCRLHRQLNRNFISEVLWKKVDLDRDLKWVPVLVETSINSEWLEYQCKGSNKEWVETRRTLLTPVHKSDGAVDHYIKEVLKFATKDYSSSCVFKHSLIESIQLRPDKVDFDVLNHYVSVVDGKVEFLSSLMEGVGVKLDKIKAILKYSGEDFELVSDLSNMKLYHREKAVNTARAGIIAGLLINGLQSRVAVNRGKAEEIEVIHELLQQIKAKFVKVNGDTAAWASPLFCLLGDNSAVFSSVIKKKISKLRFKVQYEHLKTTGEMVIHSVNEYVGSNTVCTKEHHRSTMAAFIVAEIIPQGNLGTDVDKWVGTVIDSILGSEWAEKIAQSKRTKQCTDNSCRALKTEWESFKSVFFKPKTLLLAPEVVTEFINTVSKRAESAVQANAVLDECIVAAFGHPYSAEGMKYADLKSYYVHSHRKYSDHRTFVSDLLDRGVPSNKVTKSVAWHSLVEKDLSDGDFDVIAEFLSLKTAGKPTIKIERLMAPLLSWLTTNDGKRRLSDNGEVQSFVNHVLTHIVLPKISSNVDAETKDASIRIIDSIDTLSCKGDTDALSAGLSSTLDTMRSLVELLEGTPDCKKFQIVIERGRSLREKCSKRVYEKYAQQYLAKVLASTEACELEENQLIWLARKMQAKRKVSNIEKLLKGSSIRFPLLAGLIGFGEKLQAGYDSPQCLDDLSKLVRTNSGCKHWDELLKLMDGATKDGPVKISDDKDRESLQKFLDAFKSKCGTIFKSPKAEPYVKRLSELAEAPGLFSRFFSWIFRL
jgi:hypothetical protein